MARYRHLPLLVATMALLALMPAGQADTSGPAHADAEPCLNALGIDLERDEDRDTTCTVLYAHVEDAFFWSSMNTQRPPDDIPLGMYGFNAPTLTPYYDLNVFSFKFEGGGVEYHDGAIRRHNLPLAQPITLAGADLHVRLHFTVDQGDTPLPTNADPADAGIIPCATVEVRLTSWDRERKETDLLATTAVTGHLVRPGAPVPDLSCADEASYEIDDQGVTTFDTTVRAPSVLPADRHVTLEARLYQKDVDGEKVGIQGVRLVQSPDHLNHIVFPVQDALRVDDVKTLWYEEKLYVQANITSAWGQYDVDPDALRLRILDQDGHPVANGPEILTGEVVRTSFCHGCQSHPVRATFAVDLATSSLLDGTYRVQVIAENEQHTARASSEALFSLRDDGTLLTLYDEKEEVDSMHVLGKTTNASVPGPSVALVLFGLLLLVCRRVQR